MTKNYILGLEIAQNNVVAQLSSAAGTCCWRATLASDQNGWRNLEQALALHQAHWAELLVIMEATGVYHLPWAERLTRAGAEVYVLNSLLASRLESTANALRGHKTDVVDVARLVEVACRYTADLGRFRYRSDAGKQARRQLDHARYKLREELTNLKKSAQSHLELVFPALLAAKIEPDSKCAARILEVAVTAGAWSALPLATRQQLAGRKQPALDVACAQTLADETLAQACAPALRSLLTAQQAMAVQLQQCEAALTASQPPARVALITSVPGFGQRTATVMATYLPDSFAGWGSRKKIVARLQALFGTDPRLRQSGKWTGCVKISKRGIGSARVALFQAAFCSLRTDQQNAAYYKKLRADGKAHRAAIIDLMRKQLRRLVAVLLTQQPFVPTSPLPKCSPAA